MLTALVPGMVGRSLLLCLAAILSVITSNAVAECQLVPAATIPLLADKRPLINVLINGNIVHMVVDTGAQASAVTPETVNELKLPKDPFHRTSITTIGGQDVKRNAILERLRVGTIDFSNLSVTVLALDGAELGKIAGIIGADVLSDFDLDLNIPRRTLTLYRPSDCKPIRPPWSGRYQTISAYVASRNQFFFPVELNGHPVATLFDTGSRGETVSRATAKSIGISDAQLDNDPASTAMSGGMHEYAVRRHRFDTFKVGEETLHNIPLDVADFHQPGVDMLIGADYMHWRRLFLSYSARLLFIQKEPDGAIRQELARQSQPDREHDPCRPTPDILPTLALKSPVVVSRPHFDVSKKAQADHINGCAAAMYHLASDGTPVDIKLVTEYPAGYGLGELVVRELTATKFQPQPTESKWFYEAHRFHSFP